MSLFSIIIATRNRPHLFAVALDSVVSQTINSIEIIVVNDGSDEVHFNEYKAIVDTCPRAISLYSLVKRPNGHGQSYALNFGVSKAANEYVCFLDDDDNWSDNSYLLRIEGAIAQRQMKPDLLFSNQAAYFQGRQKMGPIWLEGLSDKLTAKGILASADGLHSVTAEQLIQNGNFCHLNTLIVRRLFYEQVGGMDEGIRWECDHDLYLRLIDQAGLILLSPLVVSRHNIPNPADAASMTTMLNEVQRRVYQLRVFDKASLYSTNSRIRFYGRCRKADTLKRIARVLAKEHEYISAAFYARQALCALPTIKWLLYTSYLMAKAFGRG